MHIILWRIVTGFISIFTYNWVTLLGATLVTSSTVFITGLMGLSISGRFATPYLGIITFMVLPGFFVLGLLIIPIGCCGSGANCARRAPPRKKAACLPYRSWTLTISGCAASLKP